MVISFLFTYVECSPQPSHSDFLLEHFSGDLSLTSEFNIDFPSMIRLNNIIATTGFVVFYNCRVCDECLIYLVRSPVVLRRNDVPLDWQRSRFHLDCQTCTALGRNTTDIRSWFNERSNCLALPTNTARYATEQ